VDAQNGALTYLESQISGMSDQAKYMLVAGAVAGGRLTVIARAQFCRADLAQARVLR
jgi:hypothetical protein